MTMTTTTRDVDGVAIVDIKGRIVLGEESGALRELVADLVGKGQRHDGELKLLNLTKRVHDVMQVTKLDTVFDIMDDEAVAVKSFRQSAGATG